MSSKSKIVRSRIKFAWNEFVKECKRSGIKMNQRIAANKILIKQSSFNGFLNDEDLNISAKFICNFAYLVGLKPEHFDPTLKDLSVGVSVDENKLLEFSNTIPSINQDWEGV